MANAYQTIPNKLKTNLHKSLGLVGFDIVRKRQEEAELPITGTFPPHGEWLSVGEAEHYYIHDGYRHRSESSYYDDTENTDMWQKEVYRFAREAFDQKRLTSVCDIGCGSASKLITYFRGTNFVGLDVAATCEWLKTKYPHLTWMELDFKTTPRLSADLVICADVIEHVLDPNELLSYIALLNPRYVVLSTPDRNLLRTGTHNGPPHNPAHIREWSFAQFEAYIGSLFRVLEHFISNSAQATQYLLCTTRQQN
jgi:hypothetical protein